MNPSKNPLSTLFRFFLCLATLVALTPGGQTPASANADPGTIAYVRSNDVTGDEIRLVEPNGSSDRLLWRTNKPDQPELAQIYSLAWNPSASELAFASRHENGCSMYSSDVYSIKADGSGYRRITAPPSCGGKAGLPTGTVNVSIVNLTDSSGPFLVYFEGAPGPKSFTLSPYDSTVVTFTNVADYGNFSQWGVVMFGQIRFFAAKANADVLPGQTVNTNSALSISGGYTSWGWTNPTWHAVGSELSYIFDGAIPYTTPADSTAPGGVGSYFFDIPLADLPFWIDHLTWAPPGGRQGQALYTAWAYNEDGWLKEYVFLGTGGSTSPGEVLFEANEDAAHTILGLAWLPDSSGFVYSKTEGLNDYSNIFEYRFATGTSTPITGNDAGFARSLSISPDGEKVVFEYQATGDLYDPLVDIDLWVVERHGSGINLLVEDAYAPAWSPAALPQPVVYDHQVFLPLVRR